ncbi:peptide cleavage/export ABC transporter [Fructobacillus sp. M1-13]|uniref:Peptide cleavage/export ABC transporter n=1 Tax=Fructobacillus papyriferae TaxID=2713171 RepID=A0ABS5QR73_9LACO|nr:peptide cleavage/export ABC transporter [Fructobacillus papyriferae]MBS9334467.1 peptide cleavage/export ABC transporter [Fructobacillus papyriferae]MCD2158456.1 peptide cleavage/export ABC transporter [Fructobacillus papyriferae]
MRFRYLSQVDERDCGAACLAMVAATFGQERSIAEIRKLVKTNLEGTTALGLKKGAEKLDFTVQAFRTGMSMFEDSKGLSYPFIVHVQKPDNGQLFEHYCVIYRVAKDKIFIADPDPNVKKKSMTFDEFAEQWTGIALFFAPNPAFKPEKGKGRITGISKIIFRQKGLVANIVVASLFVTLVSIVGSYFIQLLVDEYIPNNMMSTLAIVSLGLIVAYAFQQVMTYVQQFLLIILGQRLSIDIILSYIKHLFKLPMTFFYTRRVGELTSRFNDANAVIEAVASSMLSLLIDVAIVLIMAAVLLGYNVRLFMITAISIPIYALIVFSFVRTFEKLNVKTMRSSADLESSVIERLNGMETIKSLGAESKSYGDIDQHYVQFLKHSFSRSRITVVQESLKGFLKLFFQVLVLWYGARLVVQDKLTVGELMAYNALLSYFTDPLQTIINLQSKIQTALVASHRLKEVYEVSSEFENDDQALSIEKRRLTIECHDVSFEYQYQQPILEGLNLRVAPGEKIALVGISGSGKSTLAKLFVRFFDLEKNKGKITLNGSDIRHLSKLSLRSTITYVPQEAHLFTGKIIDNLLLGAKDSTTIEEVYWATEVAEIRSDIEKMSQGYNSEISDLGTLSGGQRQRLSLARALLADSPIIVFDESTSNLDLLTEKKVVDNLLSLEEKTIIFVAHRLTIAERVERLVMLEEGRIVADGKHQDLLKTNRAYTALVQK